MSTMMMRTLFLLASLISTVAASSSLRKRTLVEDVPLADTPAPVRLPEEEDSLIASQFGPNPYRGQDPLELIISGKFILMEVHILSTDGDVVYGNFCEFDLQEHLQHQDPSLAPHFIHLYGTSRHCQEHHVSLPLHDVAQACRQQDAKGQEAKMHSVEPSAFIFHQPKAGSSLLTNMIATSSSQAGQVRVISEANALGNILTCQSCQHDAKEQALKDALYLLGRAPIDSNLERLYVKLSSDSTVGLPDVREAYPNTKWLFVQRNADTIVHKLLDSKVGRRVYGTKKRRSPGTALSELLASQGKDLSTLRDEQVCSAFLASNSLIAQGELSKSPSLGRTVQYEEDILSDEGIEQVLLYLDISPDESGWSRIQEQRNKQSNDGRGQEWKGEEPVIIRHEIQAANEEFARL